MSPRPSLMQLFCLLAMSSERRGDGRGVDLLEFTAHTPHRQCNGSTLLQLERSVTEVLACHVVMLRSNTGATASCRSSE